MMKTKFVLLVCTFCALFLTGACASFSGTENKESNMNFEYVHYHNVRIPMRDGITLAADVYLPDAPGPFPVILSRSPYGGTSGLQYTGPCKQGFAVVWVDCRGRFLSGGTCTPTQNEVEDGYDTLEWLSQQPWCDGNVGMVGGSYPALTQLTAAISGHPVLKAIAPSALSNSFYAAYYTNGVLELSFMPSWHIGLGARDIKVPKAPNWGELRKEFPVHTLDERAFMPSPSWKTISTTPDREAPFWKKIELKDYAKNIKCPFFIQTSYFDLLGRQGPEIYTELMASPDICEEFKKHSWLRIGPWGHGVNVKEGDFSFGPDALVTEKEELDFLHSILKGKDPELDKAPGRVCYFTMGENKWHYADTWPVPGAIETPFYLGSKGGANTSNGDGYLTRTKLTADQPADKFVYDPMNPVPTCGGRMVGSGGMRDQSEIEQRQDVLVYTSPELTEDLTVTGVIKAKLFVQSSAPDTDFTVKIVDVYEDGKPMNICDTIYRMRYRNGFKNPVFMKKGEIYEVNFDVDFTSYMFKKGHRVRIEISSSNFPHFERNLNTEKLPSLETEPQKAEQTILHSAQYPSCIIFPVFK